MTDVTDDFASGFVALMEEIRRMPHGHTRDWGTRAMACADAYRISAKMLRARAEAAEMLLELRTHVLTLAEQELQMQGCDSPEDEHAHAVWRACVDALHKTPNR